MAPHYECESLPLITEYDGNKVEASGHGRNKIRRVSSIQKELGPISQNGTASVFNVGINLAKTAGTNDRKDYCILIVQEMFLSCLHVLTHPINENPNETETNQRLVTNKHTINDVYYSGNGDTGTPICLQTWRSHSFHFRDVFGI